MNTGVLSAIANVIDPGILLIILLVLLIVLLALVFVLLARYGRIKTSYEIFMQGKSGKSMEEQIATIYEDLAVLKTTSEKNRRDIKRIALNMKDTYQHVGIVKYDAFKEMGGKLSFSIALLNDNATGFILNSVHSSDGCYVYTKEIIDGECAISLGDEEQRALMLAIQEEAKDTEA